MFLELIAAVSAGGCAAGVVLILNKLSGGRLPRWLMPLAAGLAMIGFSIRMEYTWYERTAGALPEGVEVTMTHEARQFWRPWTFAKPVIDRFAAIDMASVRSNDQAPDLLMANLLFFGRWSSPRMVPMIHDCAGGRVAPLLDTVIFGDDGTVLAADWAPASKDDPTLNILCK